jgi:hypothetical protein
VAIPEMYQKTGNHIYQIQNFVASLSLRLVEVHSHMALMEEINPTFYGKL